MKAFILILSLLTYNSWASNCNQTITEDYFKTKIICDSQGNVIKVSKYLLSTGTLSSVTLYQSQKISNFKTWNSDGKLVVNKDFSHYEDGSILMTEYLATDPTIVKKKQLYLPTEDDPMKSKRDLKAWKYDERHNYILKQTDSFTYFDSKKFSTKREIYREGELYRRYQFSYDPEKPDVKHPIAYDEYGPNNQFISHYRPNQFSLEDYLAEYGNQPNRPHTIAIIDSDFDLTHPMLAGFFYLNPLEDLDDINQDQNNWIDDIMGWNHETNSNILLSPILLQSDGGPASHGTHVASLALDGHESFSLIGYAGDMSNPKHLKNVTKDLTLKGVSFTNMSFSFGNPDSPFNPGSETFSAIKKLIQNTPEILHVIAAGNTGHEIDSYKLHSYPASYSFQNTLVIGALDCDQLEKEQMSTYQLADFSNFGTRHVDILAPGTMLNGASPGGGMIRYSGTSMASPYALNHGVMNAYQLNPELTSLQIKEIIIKSAYIRDLQNPAPVYSGGILNPWRIEKVALLLKDDPTLEVEEAVLQVRADASDPLPGESNSPHYLEQLRQFWNRRAAQ